MQRLKLEKGKVRPLLILQLHPSNFADGQIFCPDANLFKRQIRLGCGFPLAIILFYIMTFLLVYYFIILFYMALYYI